MKYSEARQGRVFVLRLEDGEVVHQVIEDFARDHEIKAASLMVVGGGADGSSLVVGPKHDRAPELIPMRHELENAHEVCGVGTLFWDDDQPLVHLHMVCGRGEETITGCIREGVKVWHVMEVIITELVDTSAARVAEPPYGLKLLHP